MSKYKMILVIGLLCLFFVPVYRTAEFYDFHVWECEQAHEAGKDWALCSGFWYEPSDELPSSNDCLIQLSEDCKAEVSHTSYVGFGFPEEFDRLNLSYSTAGLSFFGIWLGGV